MSSRLQNQSCRPSPVVWKKHRSKWSQRLGSRFFGPLFENGLLHFLGTNSPHVRVHERRPKHEKLKYVNPQQPSHTSPPPFHGNASFQKIHQRPPFCTSPDWLKLVGFLVGRTILRSEISAHVLLVLLFAWFACLNWPSGCHLEV